MLPTEYCVLFERHERHYKEPMQAAANTDGADLIVVGVDVIRRNKAGEEWTLPARREVQLGDDLDDLIQRLESADRHLRREINAYFGIA